MSNDELLLNRELFAAMRGKPNQNTEEARRQKLEKLLNAGAAINAQDKNDRDNTVLHVAIEKNYQEIVKFLLAKDASINVPNSDGKTPFNLAQDQRNQDLVKILTKSVNVPADSNSLFWAVTLAYLTPAQDDDGMFEQRFESLFGKDNLAVSCKLQHVRKSIRSYNPFVGQQEIMHNAVVSNLVTQEFRDRVFQHMRAREAHFSGSIPEDFAQYLDKIKTTEVWSGELEIKAMSRMLDIEIRVHSIVTTCYGSGKNLIELYQEELRVDQRNHYNFKVDLKLIDGYERYKLTFDIPSLPMKVDGHYCESATKKRRLNEPTASGSKSIKRKLSPSNRRNIPPFKRPDPEYAASGLKLSLHGTIYQLKLLIVFLQRGLAQGYAFRLATEMNAADKFDDLVFQYAKMDDSGTELKDSQGNCISVHRFLQAKHKQDESKKISYNCLSTEDAGGEFSLPKYFASYRKIKQDPEFRSSELKDFIICTNINFDFDSLTEKEVQAIEIKVADEFLDLKNLFLDKIPKRYQLKFSDQHELYDKLKSTSEINLLAKGLVEHIKDKKQMNLNSPIFQSYHAALVQAKVIAVEKNAKEERKGKFHEKFINCNKDDPNDPCNDGGLSESFKKLRETFQKHLDIYEHLSIDRDTKFSISTTFGKAKRNMRNLAEFVQELISLMKNAKDGIEVTIDRQHSTFKDNIDTLAVYVLREQDEKLQFSGEFLDLNNKLPGNLEDFREVFMKSLEVEKIDRHQLGRFEFKIYFLPADDVDNQQITNFFDTLVFAVNQPNEIELSEILKSEIGMEYNMIDSEFCVDHIQRVMLDWFKAKGTKDQEGTFFSNDLGEELMESIRQKISKIILISSKLEYCARTIELGIEFVQSSIDELQLHTFLAHENKASILYLATAQITLSAIKVYQVLQRMPEYKQDDSYIFLRQSSLLHMQDHVILAFQADTSYLLVIESEDTCLVKEVYKVYQLLAKLINSKSYTNKKIVLITNQNDALFHRFKKMSIEHIHTTDNTYNFTDLTVPAQSKVLKASKVVFQGYRVNLDDLIDEKSKKIIDPQTLVKLISKHELTISEPLAILGDTEHYYIDRTLNYQFEMRKELLMEEEEDLYAFTDIEKEDLSKQIRAEHEICLFQHYDCHNNKRFIILDRLEAAAQFNNLCQGANQKINIHLFNAESGQIKWKQSKGSIARLREYIKKEENNTKHLCETELLSHTKSNHFQVVIISDSAGMGKSTLLTKLAKAIKAADPTLWVVRINLNDYTDLLAVQKAKGCLKARNVEEALQFLEEELLRLVKPSLEQALFKLYYKKVIIIFDGFDEISPDYRETVIDLLQALRKSAIKQLWVATRPNERVLLEDHLAQFSYTLKPFSAANQIQFLRKFWQQKLEISDDDQERQEKILAYAKALIDLLARSISDRQNKFTGIPLQTKMIAEAFEKDLAEILDNDTADASYMDIDSLILHLPRQIHLIDLYERFFEQKYRIREEEKSKFDLSNPLAKKRSELYYPSFIEQHQNVAFCILFNERQVKILLTGKSSQEHSSMIDDNTGIIERGLENKPRFIHRTFAEYLAAKYIVGILAKETMVRFVLEEILLKEDYEVIRAFFNDQLAKETLPECTLNRYGHEIATLWESENMRKLFNANHDMILHLAVKEHNRNIIKFLLAGLQTHKNTLENFVNIASKRHRETALYMASERKNWDIVRLLVEQGADVNAKDREGKNVLFRAVTAGCLDMVKWLLEHGVNVNADFTGNRALHIAADLNKLDIVQYLVKNGTDINAKGAWNKTVLHRAAASGNLDMVQFLLEEGADIHAEDSEGNTMIEVAAFDGDLSILQMLVENGANLNALDSDGYGALLKAAWGCSNLKTVKFLLENGRGLKAADKDGKTWLHHVAKNGRLDIAQMLVESGADVSARDNAGNTVLHAAGTGGNLNFIKWLLEKKKLNIKATNFHGGTVLHAAARAGTFRVLEWFVYQGADVNATDNYGNTVLHEAATKNDLDLIKWLVEENRLDVRATNNEGDTALQKAAREGHLDIVKWFVEHGANVNAISSTGNSLLHEAAKGKNLNLLEWLIEEKKLDIKATNDRGRTVLHEAVDFVSFIWLVQQGADANATDNEGNTPPKLEVLIGWKTTGRLTRISPELFFSSFSEIFYRASK